MQILVKGNTNYCLESPEVIYKSYSVSSNWGLNLSENKVKWCLEERILGIQKGDDFYHMCEEIQGCDYSEIREIFNKNNISLPDYELSHQEFELIKSLANIFVWVQYFLIDEYDIESDDSLPKVFDDFKIENNNKIAVQKDIYFLPKKYADEKYQIHIANLLEINLLTYFKINTNNSEIENYFIPFTKPGYTTNVFKNSETLNFWKQILNDRHIALDNFFNRK